MRRFYEVTEYAESLGLGVSITKSEGGDRPWLSAIITHGIPVGDVRNGLGVCLSAEAVLVTAILGLSGRWITRISTVNHMDGNKPRQVTLSAVRSRLKAMSESKADYYASINDPYYTRLGGAR